MNLKINKKHTKHQTTIKLSQKNNLHFYPLSGEINTELSKT